MGSRPGWRSTAHTARTGRDCTLGTKNLVEPRSERDLRPAAAAARNPLLSHRGICFMRIALSLALLAASAGTAFAQDDSTRAPGGAGGPGGAGRATGPRPYDRVITADAKTKRGLF